MGALSGLRVLDCTHVIAGAYCSMVLAEAGYSAPEIEALMASGAAARERKEVPA